MAQKVGSAEASTQLPNISNYENHFFNFSRNILRNILPKALTTISKGINRSTMILTYFMFMQSLIHLLHKLLLHIYVIPINSTSTGTTKLQV